MFRRRMIGKGQALAGYLTSRPCGSRRTPTGWTSFL